MRSKKSYAICFFLPVFKDLMSKFEASPVFFLTMWRSKKSYAIIFFAFFCLVSWLFNSYICVLYSEILWTHRAFLLFTAENPKKKATRISIHSLLSQKVFKGNYLLLLLLLSPLCVFSTNLESKLNKSHSFIDFLSRGVPKLSASSFLCLLFSCKS